jgi:hypothetical protein
MSALRMPQALNEPSHIDTGEAALRFELFEQLDSPLLRQEQQVEATLTAFRAFEARGGSDQERERLLTAAADAVWRLIVQREAFGLCDHHLLVERFAVPAGVMARIGAGKRLIDPGAQP